MRYQFFIFITLLQIIETTSAQAMRRGGSENNASINAPKHPPHSEEFEMVPMSKSLPIGFSHFGGRGDNVIEQTPPHSSQTPPSQRRESGAPYKASEGWTIQSPSSRRSTSHKKPTKGFSSDEDSSSPSDSEFILLMEELPTDDLPESAEDWGMKNSQEILCTDSGEFVVGSPHLAPKVNEKGL